MLNQENILDEGTAAWIRHIRSRIKRNKNFLGVFIGQTGSGKSYSAVSLADIIHYYNIPTQNICFKAKTFLERLNNGLKDGTLKKGDVIVWDEASIDLNAKQWQSLTNRIINSVMTVFRNENIIVLFTVPYLSFVDSDTRKLIHAFFQARKIDESKKVCILSPYNIQVNQISGKMYRHSLKSVVRKKIRVVKSIAVPLPRKEIIDYYEAESTKFKRQIISDALDSINKIEEKKKANVEVVKLTPRQERVYVMYFKEGMTTYEIAEKLQVSQAAIHEIVQSVRKKGRITIGNAVSEPNNVVSIPA